MKQKRRCVLIAKIGLDGHDRGAKVVARALLDAGIDVEYTGIRARVDDIVETSVQKDVGVLGLSFLSGDHMTLIPKVMQKLKEAGKAELPIVVGGIILREQVQELLAMGVKKVFIPGTPLEDIVDYIESTLP